jgi:hypothetical protein
MVDKIAAVNSLSQKTESHGRLEKQTLCAPLILPLA